VAELTGCVGVGIGSTSKSFTKCEVAHIDQRQRPLTSGKSYDLEGRLMVEGQNPGGRDLAHVPKGSAIRGKDEKCSTNPTAGAGSLPAPLALSAGRLGLADVRLHPGLRRTRPSPPRQDAHKESTPGSSIRLASFDFNTREVERDYQHQRPQKRIALALSGGRFRAADLHLGVMRKRSGVESCRHSTSSPA
jgi:hypothetical protein